MPHPATSRTHNQMALTATTACPKFHNLPIRKFPPPRPSRRCLLLPSSALQLSENLPPNRPPRQNLVFCGPEQPQVASITPKRTDLFHLPRQIASRHQGVWKTRDILATLKFGK